MQKFQFLCIAIVAVFAIFLANQAAVAQNQFDALKNQFLPDEYKNRNFTIDELKKVFREKCKKASGGIDNSTLVRELEEGTAELTTCLGGIANLTALQAEITIARPIGELDTVFNKYCNKAPHAVKCLHDFNDKIQPCLSAKERKQNKVLMRIATGLLDFMCSRGGDHIALFVAEEGPECLEANQEAIKSCLNNSFHQSMPKDMKIPDIFDLPDLVLDPGHCVDLERFQKCTIHHLEQCREITPANVAESVFKFIKNETSCNEYMKTKANGNSVLMRMSTESATTTPTSSFSVFGLVLSSGLMLLVSSVIRI